MFRIFCMFFYDFLVIIILFKSKVFWDRLLFE